MSINVGSVSVKVVPDARDFNDRLRADLSNLPDQRIRVTPDMTGFRERVRQTVQPTGQESGGLLAQGMRQGFMKQSPLIVAAVAGALTAGAPAITAAGAVLVSALGAISVKSSQTVAKAWTDLGAQIKEAAQADAGSLVPVYTNVATQIGAEFHRLDPMIAQAFQASGPLVESFTSAVLRAADVAVPGLVNAVKGAGPVINGLDALVIDIGKGFAGLLTAVTQHAGAAGTALSSLGSILQTALPALGTLLGEGAELASTVLPPLASVLELVGKALNVIGPVLPTVVLGFLGFKAAQLAAGYVGTFAQRLAFASYGTSSFAGVAGRASTAISGVAKALPIIGVGVALLGSAFSAGKQDVDDWAHALLDGGNAAAQAAAQMQHIHDVTQAGLGGLHSWSDVWDRIKALTLGTNNAQADAAQKAKELTAAMSPLERAQQDVTKSQNDYLYAVQKWGSDSGQAVAASQSYRDAQQRLKDMQGLLTTATNGASTAAQQNATRLQGIATASSNASSQINLLAGALNALTGKQVSETQAQIAVTQAVNNAITSVKGLHGGLVDANGALTVQTERGAAAQQALIQLAGSDNTLIATLEKHGATTQQVAAKDAQLRDQFIQTAEKMGYTAGQAKNLADQIYGIPTQRKVEITADTNPAASALNALIGKFQSVNFGTALHARAFAEGGYTGPGAKYTPAGIVHAGEIVWSQNDVARAGGVARVEAARVAGLPGYANGGLVGNSSLMRYLVELTQAGASQFSSALQGALGGVPGAPGNVNANAALAQQMAARYYGWAGAQWNALYALGKRESGWNNTAQNPTSTAYGIPQFLNSTWATVGLSKTSNPAVQIAGMDKYIANRYGDPIHAWQHEMQFGWYDKGGPIDPGYHLIYNGTGQQELIAPKQTFEQAMSGASSLADKLTGLQISGRLEMGTDGMVTLVDGRIDKALGAVTDAVHYTGV